MNIVELQVNGKPLVFTDSSLKYDRYEFLYSKMSDIKHQAGDKPLFIFRYGEKRIGVPYDPKDEAVIIKMITQIAGILMDQKAGVKQQPSHPGTSKDKSQKTKETDTHKDPSKKKGSAIGCIALIVIIAAVIFGISKCGGETSFTKDEAVKYDNQIDIILRSVDSQENAVEKDIKKFSNGKYSATDLYSKLEGSKNSLHGNWKSLSDIEGNSEYKNSAEGYAFNYYQMCKNLQDAINEDDLEKLEDAKEAIALRGDFRNDTIKARKEFLKSNGLSDKEIEEILSQKYTFK